MYFIKISKVRLAFILPIAQEVKNFSNYIHFFQQLIHKLSQFTDSEIYIIFLKISSE